MLVAALTHWILRHKILVVLCWLGLTAAGATAAPRAVAAMSSDFGSLPGRPGYETNQQIRRLYGTGGDANPLVLVVHLPEGTTVDIPGVRAELDIVLAGRIEESEVAGRRFAELQGLPNPTDYVTLARARRDTTERAPATSGPAPEPSGTSPPASSECAVRP